jgi:hypothetical protein
MKRTLTILAVVCALAIPFTATAKNMKPGKWQITVQTEMANSPVTIPPMNMTQCITKEQAESNEPPKSPRESNDCKISDMKVEGNTVSWTMDCAKSGVHGTGAVTYVSDSYKGEMKMEMHGQTITTKMSGKYLGECDK